MIEVLLVALQAIVNGLGFVAAAMTVSMAVGFGLTVGVMAASKIVSRE